MSANPKAEKSMNLTPTGISEKEKEGIKISVKLWVGHHILVLEIQLKSLLIEMLSQ
ncbi:hypothetical protein L4C39_11200 [Vibrio clamense]|uniref:hypothetical protein n=1 Tax=Vibrio clamense TaxID=2910254 RepID=UPI003D1C9F82